MSDMQRQIKAVDGKEKALRGLDLLLRGLSSMSESGDLALQVFANRGIEQAVDMRNWLVALVKEAECTIWLHNGHGFCSMHRVHFDDHGRTECGARSLREEDPPEAMAPIGDLKGATEERFGAVQEVERLDGHWLRWPWTQQKGTNQL